MIVRQNSIRPKTQPYWPVGGATKKRETALLATGSDF